MTQALFYGADTWRVQEEAKQWLKEQSKSTIRSFPASAISDKNSGLESALIQTSNLFGPAESVWITNVGNIQSKNLSALLENAQVPVAVTAGELDGKSSLRKLFSKRISRELSLPKEKDLIALTQSIVGENLKTEDIPYIASRLPPQSGAAMGSLRSLSLYLEAKAGDYTKESLNILIENQTEDNFYTTLDKMFEKKPKDVAYTLTKLDRPLDIGALRLLQSNLIQAYTIRSAIENKGNIYEAYQSLRPPVPFFKQKIFTQMLTKYWTTTALMRAMVLTWDVEKNIKVGLDAQSSIGILALRISQIKT